MAAASPIYVGIQNKTSDSGTAKLIVSSNQMNDIITIVQALEDNDISLKAISKTIKHKTKEQTDGF